MHTRMEDLSGPQKSLVDELARCLQNMIAVTKEYDVGQDFDGQDDLRSEYESALAVLNAGKWKSASDAIEKLSSRVSYDWDDPTGLAILQEHEDTLSDLHVAFCDAFELECDE